MTFADAEYSDYTLIHIYRVYFVVRHVPLFYHNVAYISVVFRYIGVNSELVHHNVIFPYRVTVYTLYKTFDFHYDVVHIEPVVGRFLAYGEIKVV